MSKFKIEKGIEGEDVFKDLCCDDCQHWEPVSFGEKWGLCRRYPPTLVKRENSLKRVGWDFPITNHHDYCGEILKKYEEI